MENTLCEELIEKILLRLAVKSLIRFKCVRKSWFSLISDPHFANSHFELSARPSHRFLYMEAFGSEARSIDIDASLHDDSAIVTVIPPFTKTGAESFKIFGSCRGFVLLRRYSNPNLYIWNPSTGFHIQLSYPKIWKEKFFDSIRKAHLIGFGYDPSTDDYLIVVLCLNDLVFFSFRTNSWKQFNIPFVHRVSNSRVIFKQSGLVFNDAIHWLAKDDIEFVDVIIVFDLIEKNLSRISLPCGRDHVFHDLRIIGGCLSVCNETQVWVMTEYKLQSSWIMSDFPIMYTESLQLIIPLCSAKGGELVASTHNAELMKFDF
ncbi:F-box/kelch-repeat protein At3g06240-like [Gastrolobium bilobum]|uniref:F-box/kelch-repeat protein At3g06240-like n=1 Tax=Gastrolobium bilobum TaxID=150636 RepID=UPI002AB0D6CC|nr:F-box/kelch-repeat protein At3g06240-like [Gastrolobium bilobum]